MFNENDRRRFLDAWSRLGGKEGDGSGVFLTVNALYANSQRKYYTAERIQAFLAELDDVRHRMVNPELVEIALMLSNVIHNPRMNSGGELHSASFAQYLLRLSGISNEYAEGVYDLIYATWDPFKAPEHPDARMMLDISLTPLGASPDVFDKNTWLIREEYPWETDEIFLSLQVKHVHGFLRHPPIFHTEYFNAKYGKQAMENVTRLCNGEVVF